MIKLNFEHLNFYQNTTKSKLVILLDVGSYLLTEYLEILGPISCDFVRVPVDLKVVNVNILCIYAGNKTVQTF